MTKEFKKIYNQSETRYILETTSGATGSSAIGATSSNLLRELQRRISELKDTVKVPAAKPRNPTGMGSTPGRGTQKHQTNQRQKSRDDKKLNGEGVIEDEDAIKNFLTKGGQVQKGKYHKPRSSEKTNYGSRHIGTGRSGDISGVAANTRSDSKPVVSVENDQEQDHEISMASSELQSIAKDAAQLLDMVRQKSEEEGLEAWQQSKITKAADFMNSVLQSLSGDEQGVAERADWGGPLYDPDLQKGKKKPKLSDIKAKFPPNPLPKNPVPKEQGVAEGLSKQFEIIYYKANGDKARTVISGTSKEAVARQFKKQHRLEIVQVKELSQGVAEGLSKQFEIIYYKANGDKARTVISGTSKEAVARQFKKQHRLEIVQVKELSQGVAEGLSDTQKKIEDTINKLEDRLKHAKSDEQWDRISARIERLQAGLNRSKQGVAESEPVPGKYSGHFYDAKILSNGDYEIVKINSKKDENGKSNPLNLEVGAVVPKSKAHAFQYIHNGGMFDQLTGVAEDDGTPGYIKYEQMKDKIASVLIKLYNQGKDEETIKQMSSRVARHLGYNPEDPIYQDAWMSSFTDASLDGSLDREPEDDYTDYTMRQGEMGRKGMAEVFKGPSDYEIYNLKTNKKASKPFKADHQIDAEYKAGDILEKLGIPGRGFSVRLVQSQGVAEGPTDSNQRDTNKKWRDEARTASKQGHKWTPTNLPRPKNVGEEKKKGADGKACWKGYRYNGTKDGVDSCVKVSEDAYLESLASKLEELKKK